MDSAHRLEHRLSALMARSGVTATRVALGAHHDHLPPIHCRRHRFFEDMDLGADQKFHCSWTNPRKGRLRRGLNYSERILWWMISAEIARKPAVSRRLGA